MHVMRYGDLTGDRMIVGEQKPLQEICDLIDSVKGSSILVVGCDSCMTVSLAGGKEEVRDMVAELRHHSERQGRTRRIKGLTLKRQCESGFEDGIVADVDSYDIVLSLGCSIGAQMLSERFPSKPIVPGINTSNMGAPERRGVYKEKCIGCGDCTIYRTAGICTLTRCSKGLQNGPCGGSVDGKCEVDPNIDCAWYQVYEALKNRGELENLSVLTPPKDWSKSHSGGVRTIRTRD